LRRRLPPLPRQPLQRQTLQQQLQQQPQRQRVLLPARAGTSRAALLQR
jgi:hypothetical protein